MDNSQKSENKSSEPLPQEDQVPRQVPQADSSPSKEAPKILTAPEFIPSRPSEPLPPQTPDPQPSSTGMEVDEILENAKSAANPTAKDGKSVAPKPLDGKIHVSEPKMPGHEQLQRQKPIDAVLQVESIAKKVCKLKGHWIEPMNLRATIPNTNDPGQYLVHETTIVICRQCGASLIQIRG
jgi:hypothetical protein